MDEDEWSPAMNINAILLYFSMLLGDLQRGRVLNADAANQLEVDTNSFWAKAVTWNAFAQDRPPWDIERILRSPGRGDPGIPMEVEDMVLSHLRFDFSPREWTGPLPR